MKHSLRFRVLVVSSLTAAALGALALAALGGEGGPSRPPGQPPAGPEGAAALLAFDSCDALLGRLADNPSALSNGVPPGTVPVAGAIRVDGEAAASTDDAGGASAAAEPALADPLAPSATGTNVQEAGVDEPDLVKSDGVTIFALRGRELFAVSADRDPRRLDSLTLPGRKLGAEASELLLYEGRLLVLSERQRMRPDPHTQTVLIDVDVGDPAVLRVERRAILDGGYLSARLSGSTVRIALASRPSYPIEVEGSGGGEVGTLSARINPDAAAESERWLPQAIARSDGHRSEGSLLGCNDVRSPAEFSGTGMLSVSTIDLAEGLDVVGSDAVLADGGTVYASAGSLYVATAAGLPIPDVGFPETGPPAASGGAPVVPAAPQQRTEIHRFDTSAGGETRYVASGDVDGLLINQYSMSEYEGELRVATTLDGFSGDVATASSEGVVTTLGERGDELVEIGRLHGLGRGEQIQAVRFVGRLGFVVTFRQVDPLHVIDLSDPERPAELGELRVPGYSAYLHPVGDDRLLGVGQDVSADGLVRGAQVSLFDVADLSDPRRLDQLRAGELTTSPVEFDARAFTYLPEERLAVVPIDDASQAAVGAAAGSEPAGAGVGAIAYEVGRDGSLRERARLTDPDGSSAIRRSLAVDGTLFTVSDRGIAAHDLGSPDLGITGSASLDAAG